MSKRNKVIVSLTILWAIIGMLCWQSAWAIETTVLAVVQDGSIRTSGAYYAFGGKATTESPAFQNEYKSSYQAIGSAGFAQGNSFAGNIVVKEQFELQKGTGSFFTKAGTGVLVNIPRQPVEGQESSVPIIDGTLRMNAVGFGGTFLGPGVVLSTFGTAEGLKGACEAEMLNGQFKAGAIQRIQTGSNEQPIQPPTIVEYNEMRWNFSGKFQVKVEISFPK